MYVHTDIKRVELHLTEHLLQVATYRLLSRRLRNAPSVNELFTLLCLHKCRGNRVE